MIGLILFIVAVAIIVTTGLIFNRISKKKTYELFKPGMTMEFYAFSNHGKFKKEFIIGKFEILDVDGQYAWVKDEKTGEEFEENLYYDCYYSDKLILKDSDENIVRIFSFD